MDKLRYSILIQWKIDLRNKNILLVYYVVPLLFYVVMGAVFSSITPESKNTLIQSMSIFAVSMGALVGAPVPLVDFFGSDMKKSYQAGNIPLWVMLVVGFISGLIHLFIVSCIIFFSAPLLFDAQSPTQLLIYFPSLILFISTSLLVGLLIGLVAKRTTVMTVLAQMIFLPSLLLSGIMFPAEMLPEIFRKISVVFPATQGMQILTDTGTFLLVNYLPMLGIAGILFLVITLIYQKRLRN